MADQRCIPQEEAEQLRKSIKQQFKGSRASKLAKASPEERARAIDQISSTIAADSEQRDLIKETLESQVVEKQKQLLQGQLRKAEKQGQANASQVKSSLDKIAEMDNMQAFTDNFYEGVAQDKLGQSVTAEEAEALSKDAEQMKQYIDQDGKLKDEFTESGVPVVPIEYAENWRRVQKNINRMSPSPAGDLLTKGLPKMAMIGRVSSWVKDNWASFLNGTIQKYVNNITPHLNKQLPGTKQMVKEYRKHSAKVYQKTMMNPARAQNKDMGMDPLNEQTVQPGEPGLTSVHGILSQLYEWGEATSYKISGYADSITYSGIFADMASRQARDLIRNRTGKKDQELTEADFEEAREMFKDSLRIEPKTEDGQHLREIAQEAANGATLYAKTPFSEWGTSARRLFNGIGDTLEQELIKQGVSENVANGIVANPITAPVTRAGDVAIPFVTSAANAVNLGLKLSGLRIPDSLWKLYNYRNGGDPQKLQEAWSNIAKSGLGLAGGYVLSSAFSASDYIPQYAVAGDEDKERARLNNASYNSLRVNLPGMGEQWVKMDYFGPAASPLMGMMMAKKGKLQDGDDPISFAGRYLQGAGIQALTFPGPMEVAGTVSSAKQMVGIGEGESFKPIDSLVSNISNRYTPGMVSDFAQMTDKYQRTSYDQGAAAKFQEKIPLLRQALPARYGKLGEKKETGSWHNELLFGSGVNKAETGTVVNELSRLAGEGEKNVMPTWLTNTVTRDGVTVQIPQDDMPRVRGELGNRRRKAYYDAINDASWNRMSAQEQAETIQKIERDLKRDFRDEMFDAYNEREFRQIEETQ